MSNALIILQIDTFLPSISAVREQERDKQSSSVVQGTAQNPPDVQTVVQSDLRSR